MSREEIICPVLTRLSGTEPVANALGEFANMLPSHQRGQSVLCVESDGTTIRWITGDGGLEFERGRVESLALSNIETNGEKFISFDVSFTVNDEQVTYGLIVSHETEASWLKGAAQKISRVFDWPIS